MQDKRIKTDMAIIVEGKYDKIKLSELIDAPIITTDGFGIFKNKAKREMIRTLADTCGIIILTDSDAAGFRIRNHIKGFVSGGKIINAYIPQIKGTERRKATPSPSGLIGVEGMDAEVLASALKKAGIDNSGREDFLDKARFMEDGLIGGENSHKLRQMLLKELGLPDLISTSAAIAVLNRICTEKDYLAALNRVRNDAQIT